MTTPPLPEFPCVRVSLDYEADSGQKFGSRFFLRYTGDAPSGANCITLAGDVATAWGAEFASQVASAYMLKRVDVLDIATDSGLSGQWTGSTAGGQTTTPAAPISTAINIEFGLARRYRGGKPRMYLPPPSAVNMLDTAHWNAAVISSVNTNAAAFFATLEGLTVGGMGTLSHVSLSYYESFTNPPIETGRRERSRPTYRATAKVDNVTGYFTKTVIGSQRRRRTSTTY